MILVKISGPQSMSYINGNIFINFQRRIDLKICSISISFESDFKNMALNAKLVKLEKMSVNEC